MKNLFRSLAAVALAVAGLLAVVSAPASAGTSHKKSVVCYRLRSNKVQSKRYVTKGGVCPKGWSKHRPKPKPVASGLQGTNKSGDIDLVVPSSVSLAINGSSFDAPMVGATTSGSTAYSAGGKVHFSSYPAAGSGTGRTTIVNGSVNIGFSDQPMTPAAGTLPTGATEANFVQVPYILGGAVVGYNLAGAALSTVKLTSQEVAQIYDGQITTWSNPAIVATNGGASSTTGKALQALYTTNSPSNTIKVIYRAASSGTTYAFTDWLHSAGGSSHTPSGNVMEGSGNAFHAPNILAAANNAALATDINSNPGSIGYVEYSYLLIPGNAAIQTASLQDKNGQWLQPTLTNIAAAAAAAGTNITPDAFSIVNQPGNNVWPLATYSWAIVAKNQTNEANGEAIVKYLDWETHYAQGVLAKAEGYVPLPAAVAAYSRQQLMNVTSGGSVLLTKNT